MQQAQVSQDELLKANLADTLPRKIRTDEFAEALTDNVQKLAREHVASRHASAEFVSKNNNR